MIGKDPPPLSATEVCARQGTRPDAIAAKLGVCGVLEGNRERGLVQSV
jgi:hypothetical protein